MLSGLAMTTQQGAVHVAIIDFLTFHHALCHRLGRMSVLAVFYSGDSISIHFIACICFTDSFFYSAAPSPCWQGVYVLRSGISIPCACALVRLMPSWQPWLTAQGDRQSLEHLGEHRGYPHPTPL